MPPVEVTVEVPAMSTREVLMVQVLRRALMMIVTFIDKTYGIDIRH